MWLQCLGLWPENTKPAWHVTLLLTEQTSLLGDLDGPTLLLETTGWACSAILWHCVLPPPKEAPTPVSGRGPFFFPTPLSLVDVVVFHVRVVPVHTGTF